MYGLKELKPTIKIDDNTVECPVKSCSIKVKRQRRVFKRETIFQCPIHKIYISPTTFEYETKQDNLLWTDKNDRILYNEILKYKRESRIARDNSEDALTWNVMRFLDRQNLLPDFLSQLSSKEIKKTELILWSYSPDERSNWSLLNKARLEFGETVARGSEPDIVILTDKVLYFLEAKLTAKNETKPSNLINRKKYETGGNNLYRQIFISDYDTIAVKDERYELMRYWILGSWMAKQLDIDFEFYSLVMQSREQQLESEFDEHINETDKRKFSRMTWEQIYQFIKSTRDTKEKQIMVEYFCNKTIGYSSDYKLLKAFNI